MLLGAHQSIAGGVHKAFERAEADGCEAFQLFTKNARGWQAKPLDEPEATAFKAEFARTGLPSVAHGSYLVNLACADEAIRAKSVECFTDELGRCEVLGVGGLVIHPGAHADLDVGIRLIARGLDHALATLRGGETRVLLEVTAGQGVSIGHRFEHLAAIFDAVKSNERLGVCLDTCHLFMAGYDLSTESGYRRVMKELDRTIGLEHVHALHLNDCKKELGARVDRHEDIGKGTLGLEPFRWVVNDPRFERAIGVLETPNYKNYKKALKVLRALRGPAKRSPRAARAHRAA